LPPGDDAVTLRRVTDLVIRPLAAGEEPLFGSLADGALVGPAAFGARYADIAARGNYRPANTWVALRDGVVVARAAWWGRPQDDAPVVLDWFDFVDQDAAVRLLRAAPGPAEYSLALPPGWRGRPAVAQAAQARIAAAAAVGMKPLVERYGYRWTRGCGLPPGPGGWISARSRTTPFSSTSSGAFTRAASTRTRSARSPRPGSTPPRPRTWRSCG
jgi:hypothetical protein